MIPTLFATKLYIPRLTADLVERPRVYDLLERGLKQGGLTVVIAPAGYGKSTAVASWLRRAVEDHPELVAAWYTADSLDNDPLVFLAYLTRALRQVRPNALPSTYAMLISAPNQSVESIAGEFVREAALMEEVVALVIDDYHTLTDEGIHEFMRRLLRHRPPALRLYLTARHDPPLGLPALRARGSLTEVRAASLAFRDDEALALLQAAVGDDISAQAVQVLQECTEGWAVGLRLAAIPLRNLAERDAFINSFRQHGHRYILDYLVDEVLETQPPEMRTFLLRTALLNRFDAVGCVVVGAAADEREARQQIRRLQDENLFVVSLDHEGRWYRYHHQFQSMLLNRLLNVAVPGAIQELHNLAAEWYLRNGLEDEALHHFREAGNREAIIFFIERQATQLENQDRWIRLRKLLSYVPMEVILQRPGLLLPHMWTLLLQLEWDQIPPMLDHAEALLNRAGCEDSTEEARGLLGEFFALRGAAVNNARAPGERRDAIHRALELLPRTRSWARAYAFASLVYLTHSADQLDDLVHIFETEIATAGMADEPYIARLLQGLGLAYFRLGTLDRLESTCRRYVALASRHNMPVTAAYGQFNLGIARFYRGQTESAIPHLEHVLDYPYLVGGKVVLSALYPLLSLYQEADRPERLKAAIETARLSLTSTHDGAELDALQAYADLLTGDLNAALTWADGLAHPVSRLPEEVQALILARVRLAQGDPAGLMQAAEVLAAYVAALEESGEARQRIHALVTLARVEWALDQRSSALDHLVAALQMGYDRGYRRWFLEEDSSLADMYRALIQREREPQAAYLLLRSLRADGAPPAHLDVAPVLTDREYEVLVLVARKLTNKEIGRALSISELTVRNHLANIGVKLGTNRRAAAVRRAQVLGLL